MVKILNVFFPLRTQYYILEETGTLPPEQMACNVDVPKVLGDIFESVAGAIFIDSGIIFIPTFFKSCA